MFEVILSPESKAFFEAADRPLAKKLARCFEQLERDPRASNNIKQLTVSSPDAFGIVWEIGE